MAPLEKTIDQQNAAFWDELCGTGLAKSIGIRANTAQNLRYFDQAYFEMYPYLRQYAVNEDLQEKKILEIGLGYGSLGQLLVDCGGIYYGMDIAKNPVLLMQYRLKNRVRSYPAHVQVASILNAPFKTASFHYIYSIGCLHHTGNLSKAINEVYRLLKPGGRAVIMIYNRFSFRRLAELLKWFDRKFGFRTQLRACYDHNRQGQAAPHTDFLSIGEAKRLFKNFSSLKIDIQNFGTHTLFKGRVMIPRKMFLNNLGRILGLDLYLIADKSKKAC